MLKQMLEGYLNQTTKPIPDLQQEANMLAKAIIDSATDEAMETSETNGNVQPSRLPNSELPSRRKA